MGRARSLGHRGAERVYDTAYRGEQLLAEPVKNRLGSIRRHLRSGFSATARYGRLVHCRRCRSSDTWVRKVQHATAGRHSWTSRRAPCGLRSRRRDRRAARPRHCTRCRAGQNGLRNWPRSPSAAFDGRGPLSSSAPLHGFTPSPPSVSSDSTLGHRRAADMHAFGVPVRPLAPDSAAPCALNVEPAKGWYHDITSCRRISRERDARAAGRPGRAASFSRKLPFRVEDAFPTTSVAALSPAFGPLLCRSWPLRLVSTGPWPEAAACHRPRPWPPNTRNGASTAKAVWWSRREAR